MKQEIDMLIVCDGLGSLSAALGNVGAGIQVSPNITRLLHRWGFDSALHTRSRYTPKVSSSAATAPANASASRTGARK